MVEDAKVVIRRSKTIQWRKRTYRQTLTDKTLHKET